MIARLIRWIRSIRIRLLEQDLQYAAATYSEHVRGIHYELAVLRREQWRDLSAEDIAREMDRKGWRHG